MIWLVYSQRLWHSCRRCFSLVQWCLTLCNPMGLHLYRLPCPSPFPRACSNSCPLSWWWNPTISSSVTPFSSCPQSFPATGSFSMSQLLTSGSQSIGVSASAAVFTINIQCWFSLGLTGWFPCCPRDSQESSPAPQFESINSSVLSLFYGPTLTSIHDYWKNYSFDYIDLLCWLGDVSGF